MGLFVMLTFSHMKKALFCLTFLLLTTCFFPLCAAPEYPENPEAQSKAIAPSRILFLMQAGHTHTAMKLYQEYYVQLGHHDRELVRQIGLAYLDQGNESSEPERQLLTLFGAGISMDEKALYILEDGLKSRNPQLQLVAMNFLSRLQNDSADDVLKRGMSSNYLLVRFECLSLLAEKKVPSASEYVDALMCKVDPTLIPLFPQFYAKIGNADAMKVLRKLLANPKEKVRIEAILSAAKYGRDDLLPTIRTLATHHLMIQQEACALYLGLMKDEASAPKLEAMTRSGSTTVRLAALQALYRLGRHEVLQDIEKSAKANDLFAITILGEIPGSENLLAELAKSSNIQVRVNATLALLNRLDSRCLASLADILLRDSRDFAFAKTSSPSKALSCYKVIPSARQNMKEDAIAFELSLNIRESALEKTLELPEKNFLQVANAIFEAHQHDLIPTLVDLLEELRTPDAIALLKKHYQKAGAPLIRNYCNLALYRLKEEGPYADNLKAWIVKQQNEDFIFRPMIPWEMREESGPHQLTAQETSRLLIESFETLTENQDDWGINVLLNAICNGNSNNKYALAGLLIRAAQ